MMRPNELAELTKETVASASQSKTKERNAKQAVGILIILLIAVGIILLIKGIYKQYSLEVARRAFPDSTLEMNGGERSFPSDTLTPITQEILNGYTLTRVQTGAINTDNLFSCINAKGEDGSLIYVSGVDMGDLQADLRQYSVAYYNVLGVMKVDYDEVVSDSGYFDGYHAEYSAGILHVKGMQGRTTQYVQNYRIHLNSNLQAFFSIATMDKALLPDGKKLAEEIMRIALSYNSALSRGYTKSYTEPETNVDYSVDVPYEDSVYKQEGSVSFNDIVSEKTTLPNGDVTWIQDGRTYIETVNFDYTLCLRAAYSELRVEYSWMDITDTPDTIFILSPDGTTYQPTSYEADGRAVFRIENAAAGDWILSVRNDKSLGGANVDFWEQSEWELLQEGSHENMLEED